MRFLAEIRVLPKAEVADPQGKAVGEALWSLGYKEVSGVRVGKFMEVIIEGSNIGEARSRVAEMCQKLLANPVIEDFLYDIKELDGRG